MKRIESFEVDHLKLHPGLYVSRRDKKFITTTFDIRMTRPNFEPVMDMGAIHTIEHLGATFLRNSVIGDEIIYFGPMGCRTGFYLIVFRNQNPQDILSMVIKMFEFIINFEGDIPGATAIECGNFLEQNLPMAKYYLKKYLEDLDKYKAFTY